MSASGASPHLDGPVSPSSLEEWKSGPGKNTSIVRSSSAVASLTSSFVLLWILRLRSRARPSTTYHRLLLGLSASDVLLSSSYVTFGAATPRELGYVVWNARGSMATCDAFGFLGILGGCSALLYCASLNLYYLAQIKYNRTDSFIERRVEPWLHASPVLFGLAVGTVNVTGNGINPSLHGSCGPNTYTPPHCDGREDGEVPPGFDIPCGRGRTIEPFSYATGLVTMLAVPVAVGGSLWMIYRSVSESERRVARYGAGALNANSPLTNGDAADADTDASEGGGGGGRRRSSILSMVSSAGRRFSCARRALVRPDHSDRESSQGSRAVLHRAAAYSLSYLLTWGWWIIYLVLNLAGAWTNELPLPTWQINFDYVWNFFGPFQGMWTFLIYMHPRVVNTKRSSDANISWFGAFFYALWLALTGRRRHPRNRREGNADPRNRREENAASAPGSGVTPGGLGTNASLGVLGTDAASVAGVVSPITKHSSREEENTNIEDEE